MGVKITTTLEISSICVKCVTGYLLDKRPVILDASSVALPENAIKDGMINDYGAVAKAVNSLITSVNERLKIVVSAVTLVLPSIGFEVYENEQTTAIVSSINEIAALDIENVRSQVSKANVNEGLKIIDVIADDYIYDEGHSKEPPIGKTSRSLQIKAKLHALPIIIVDSYTRIITQLGIKISRVVASVYAGAELVKNLVKLPKNYILVDLGANIVNAALIGENQVYTSTFERFGGNEITKNLSESLGITFEAAQHLKERYGVDLRKTTYSTNILSEKIGNKKVEITNKDFNEKIYGIASKYVLEINKVIKEIQNDDNYYESLPLIFVGGGSKLYGLMDLVKDLIKPQSAYIVNPFAVGARDGRFSNCVGALIIEGNAPVLRDDLLDDDLTDYESYTNRKIKLRRVSNDDK